MNTEFFELIEKQLLVHKKLNKYLFNTYKNVNIITSVKYKNDKFIIKILDPITKKLVYKDVINNFDLKNTSKVDLEIKKLDTKIPSPIQLLLKIKEK